MRGFDTVTARRMSKGEAAPWEQAFARAACCDDGMEEEMTGGREGRVDGWMNGCTDGSVIFQASSSVPIFVASLTI